MNWKIIVGVLLIIGSVKELLSIIVNYNSGKLQFWPFGAQIGCVLLFSLGAYLIHVGKKEKELRR